MANDIHDGAAADLILQRERLARWLVEWQLAEALDGEIEDEGGLPAGSETGAGNLATSPDRETPVQVGHVRLLAPEGESTSSRPLFVAVLEINTTGQVQVAPFGRFSEPALPGEWLTGRNDPALRVLCLWNTRSMPALAAGRSWWVDALSPVELSTAREVWSGWSRGVTAAGTLASQVGSGVSHPEDPRWVYQFRERTHMDRVTRELASPYIIGETRDWRLAAETGPDEDGFKPKV